jgi:hypothetical protein
VWVCAGVRERDHNCCFCCVVVVVNGDNCSFCCCVRLGRNLNRFHIFMGETTTIDGDALVRCCCRLCCCCGAGCAMFGRPAKQNCVFVLLSNHHYCLSPDRALIALICLASGVDLFVVVVLVATITPPPPAAVIRYVYGW